MMKKWIAAFAVLIVLTVSVVGTHAAAERSLTDGSRYAYTADIGDNGAERSDAAADDSIENSDGINTNAATVWIIAISAAMACAVTAGVIVLARKNIGKKN